jgi:uncharacterized protein YceH (UPF0502 family)
MAWSKEETERRVLGVLIEKSLTQLDYYPMTLNAIVTACNQKQNRDPVMDVDEDAVFNCLEELRLRGIVTVQLPGHGARTKRYKHEVESHFRWEKRERAVMTELLLRGPQTLGELRTRCSRMASFENLDIVANVLQCLADYDPPCTAQLPREAGRSAVRYRQLLYEEPSAPAVAAAPAAAPEATTAPARNVSVPSPAASRADEAVNARGLQSDLEAMQVEIGELHETIADLARRLDALEQRFNQ